MEFSNYPTLCIPCDTIEHLKELVDALYKKEILTDETICFKNCPDNLNDILNKPNFFEPVEIGGIKAVKGQIEKNTNELL